MKHCPCHSGLPYSNCCEPLHLGKPAHNAYSLMRSRYAAYALNLADYIIQTTHPKNPAYQINTAKWKDELNTFNSQTSFINLEMLGFEEDNNQAFVTFRATLSQGNQDSSFSEKSSFLKENGKWLYKDGIISH